MKTVYYVGFYSSPEDKLQRKNVRQSIAGAMKMDFILKCLRKLDCKIVLVSIMPSRDSGFQPQETFVINDRETHVYLPAFVLRVFGKNIVRGDLSLFFLKRFMQKNVAKDDVVVSYHSLIFGQFFQKLRKKLGFRWVCEVEEIYTVLTTGMPDADKLSREESGIKEADGYIMANDRLAKTYAGEAPCAVAYGNYTVFIDESDRKKRDSEDIVLVYAGGIREQGDLFVLLDAMEYLPCQYVLRILGTGNEKDMELMRHRIQKINERAGGERIKYCGLLRGKEYTEFLSKCDIGCSLMEQESGFSTAFPSKILTYLGHSLKVVSSEVDSIRESSLADLICFSQRDGESVAQAIQSINPVEDTHCSDRLRMLENTFKNDLMKVVG